jgi:hypothetical protein
MEAMHSRRTDAELLAVLDEEAIWLLNGSHGVPLCLSFNLRDALRQALDSDGVGKGAQELCRQPDDNIIVTEAQLEHLKQLVAMGLTDKV